MEIFEARFAARYRTPQAFDDLMMSSDGEALTGLWFEGSPDAAKHAGGSVAHDFAIFRETADWLDSYFAGYPSAKLPHCRISGLTPFREMVIEEMLKIPFGETIAYGEIAAHIAKRCGRDRMSAQAVGSAVGWNPICIVIPCHRVVGSGGGLVGYGGGLSNKSALLTHEKCRTRLVSAAFNRGGDGVTEKWGEKNNLRGLLTKGAKNWYNSPTSPKKAGVFKGNIKERRKESDGNLCW